MADKKKPDPKRDAPRTNRRKGHRCGGCGRWVPEREYLTHASRCDRSQQ